MRDVWRPARDDHADSWHRPEALAGAVLGLHDARSTRAVDLNERRAPPPRAADLTARLRARAAEIRRLLGVHVGRTRQLLVAMLVEKMTMVPVVVAGRRGYRFR